MPTGIIDDLAVSVHALMNTSVVHTEA